MQTSLGFREKNMKRFFSQRSVFDKGDIIFLRELLDKLEPITDLFGIDKHFDNESYFRLILTLRILNKKLTFKKRLEILKNPENYLSEIEEKIQMTLPQIVRKHFKWWLKIGVETKSQYDIHSGDDNSLLPLLKHDKVSSWIKIHLLSRFIMKRNRALEGSKNFETKQSSEIIQDSQRALDRGRKIMTMAKVKGETMEESKYYGSDTIECLLSIQEMLFVVRTEKDINHVISKATNSLSITLVLDSKVDKLLYSYWCYNVLWRCFRCLGDDVMVDLTSDCLEKFNEKINDEYGFDYMINNQNNIENDADIIYKKWTKIYESEKIPKLTSNINKLFSSDVNRGLRENFYINFIGIKPEEFREIITQTESLRRKKKSGQPIRMFTHRPSLHPYILNFSPCDLLSHKNKSKKVLTQCFHKDCRKSPPGVNELFIFIIPNMLEKTMERLLDSSSMVSIPTIRLTIIDQLLWFSSILTEIEYNIVNTNKNYGIITEEIRDKLEYLWGDVMRQISKIIKILYSTREILSTDIGNKGLNDFNYIILELEKIYQDSVGSYTLQKEGQDYEININSTKKASESIWKIIKNLFDKKSEQHFTLFFPIRGELTVNH